MAERHEAANEDDVEVELPPSSDSGPAALALSVGKGSRDRNVNAKTAAFLDEQTAILRLQKEHLHEQRELQLSHLKWRRFSDWMKAALQLSTALVAVAVAAGVGAAIWDAVHANSVVVDAFRSPPGLSAKGLDGTVMASGVLDELNRMQAETRAARAKRGVKDAWSSDIKVEVPDTGVSIGEVMRDLHRWLGHETHVAGDLVETEGGGLRLTVRGDGIAAKSFDGTAAELPKLATQAAEYVYGEAEPYFAATYLIGHGRDAEALPLVRSKFESARPEERPYLLNSWGNALLDFGRINEALPKYQEAVRLKPDYWSALVNMVNVEIALQREEGAWRDGVAMQKAAHRGQTGAKVEEYYFNYPDLLTWNLGPERAAFVADMEQHGGIGSNVAQNGPLIADVAARMHDPAAAELYLQTSIDVDKDPFAQAMIHFVHGWGALDRGDGPRAAQELEAFNTAYPTPSIGIQVPGYHCWLAQAEEMAGHPDKADAVLASGGRYVDCWRFKADILDHRGDWAGAQKAYADAVALAPDLPAAYYSWGLALARHGDLSAAEARFAQAHERGPRWADPLKAWGDALGAQGRLPEAEVKYAEAVKDAPRWIALRLAYGNALRAERKFREAIAQYHAVSQAAGHG
jgi:tetratricopeptide (TPR) repeat protein